MVVEFYGLHIFGSKKVKIILPMGFFVLFVEFLWKFQYQVF